MSIELPPTRADELTPPRAVAGRPRRQRSHFFILSVVVMSLMVYTVSLLVIYRRSSEIVAPTALIAVKGNPDLATATVRVVGVTGSVSGTFDPAEDYICRLHVMPGRYRVAIIVGERPVFIRAQDQTEFEIDPYRPLYISLGYHPATKPTTGDDKVKG